MDLYIQSQDNGLCVVKGSYILRASGRCVMLEVNGVSTILGKYDTVETAREVYNKFVEDIGFNESKDCRSLWKLM